MKPTLLCCGALALLLGICLLTAHPAWYGLALVNLLTFSLYGGDKLAAQRQWRRIPERTLLGLGVVGAGPADCSASGCFAIRRARRHSGTPSCCRW
ncbi:DUF1294 domain-containing protein [Edwardsiella tarda]